MLNGIYAELAASQSAPVIISVSLMLFLGFLMTRVTKLARLPNVTAYILVGILIGPYCLNLIPAQVVEGMDFLSDIALAFIAFSVGEFFMVSALKKNGVKVIVITLLEAGLASALVFVMLYWVLGLSFGFAIVLAALASATSSASTLMTIRQTRARGDFVDTLLQVVALDNMLSLVAYSMAISVALHSMGRSEGAGIGVIAKPILINLGVAALGGLFGAALKVLFRKRSTDNRLIVSIAMLFAFCGICVVLDVSPLLGCMSMGMVYINLTGDHSLFKQLNYFSPPLLLLFFVRSGLSFQLDALAGTGGATGTVPLLIVGVAYVVVRMAGKYLGSMLGGMLVKKPPRVRNCLGLALVPQAGVAIGLAALGARSLGGQLGEDLQTIILAASVLYELVGPACAKLSLYLSGSYSEKLEDLVAVEEMTEDNQKKTELELLIERIQRIQKELPAHNVPISEEEAAFTEAAYEHQLFSSYMVPGRMNSRR